MGGSMGVSRLGCGGCWAGLLGGRLGWHNGLWPGRRSVQLDSDRWSGMRGRATKVSNGGADWADLVGHFEGR